MKLRWFAQFKVSAVALGVSLAMGVVLYPRLLMWLIGPARDQLRPYWGCFSHPSAWTLQRDELVVVLGVAWLPSLPFIVSDAWRLVAPPRAQRLRIPLALTTTLVAVASLLLARQLAWPSLVALYGVSSAEQY